MPVNGKHFAQATIKPQCSLVSRSEWTRRHCGVLAIINFNRNSDRTEENRKCFVVTGGRVRLGLISWINDSWKDWNSSKALNHFAMEISREASADQHHHQCVLHLWAKTIIFDWRNSLRLHICFCWFCCFSLRQVKINVVENAVKCLWTCKVSRQQDILFRIGRVLAKPFTFVSITVYLLEKKTFSSVVSMTSFNVWEEATVLELAVKSHRLIPISVSKAFFGRSPTFD